MKPKDTPGRILAEIGTILVWLPVAASLISTILLLIQSGVFQIDYLLPVETAPCALVGSLLIWWAALRAKFNQKAVGVGMAGVTVFLVGTPIIAIVNSPASSGSLFSPLQSSSVVAGLVGFDLALIWIGIAGIQLTQELIRRNRPPADSEKLS